MSKKPNPATVRGYKAYAAMLTREAEERAVVNYLQAQKAAAVIATYFDDNTNRTPVAFRMLVENVKVLQRYVDGAPVVGR